MAQGDAGLFAGLAAEELAAALAPLERRAFPAGATVLAEGDDPREMYLIRDGAARVSIAGPDGSERTIATLGPGATVGEMSLFTGQAVSATVRAAPDADLDVLVLRAADLQRLLDTFPAISRNLGMIFAERLARTNRLALRDTGGRVAVLDDHGAPPLLGYALACSVAWHTRAPTLLLMLADSASAVPDDLAALAAARPMPDHPLPDLTARGEPAAAAGRGPAEGALHVLVTAPTGTYAPAALPQTIDDLRTRYAHVLLQVPAGLSLPALDAQRVRLTAEDASPAPVADRPSQAISAIRAWVPDDRSVTHPDRQGVLHVPALDAEDEQALQRGALPISGRAGKVLGRAARQLAGLTVGLALSGGAQRGYAHLGALAALARRGVPVDFLAGTSIGAAVAAMYALGYTMEQAADLLDTVGATSFRLALPHRSFLSSQGLRSAVLRYAGDRRFEDLDLPLALVAVDLPGQREVMFRRGLLWPALLASVSIAVIYPAQRMGPYLLVDGGLLNPLPLNAVAAMGADVSIGIKLFGRVPAPETDAEAIASRDGGPPLLQAIMTTIQAIEQKTTLNTTAAATIMIEPQVEGISVTALRNFSRGRRCIPEGEKAVAAALPRLAAALPWLRA